MKQAGVQHKNIMTLNLRRNPGRDVKAFSCLVFLQMMNLNTKAGDMSFLKHIGLTIFLNHWKARIEPIQVVLMRRKFILQDSLFISCRMIGPGYQGLSEKDATKSDVKGV